MESSSSHHGPPIAAFQSLPLTKTKHSRSKRRSNSYAARSGPKTPIDPLDALETIVVDDDDAVSTCTRETIDSSGSINSNSNSKNENENENKDMGLFENLHRNWCHRDTNEAHLEQACFASYIHIFYSKETPLPLPPFAVVDGLWSQVILPEVLKEQNENDDDDDNNNKLPQLVSQDVWKSLRQKLSFLHLVSSSNSNSNSSHMVPDTVQVTHSMYVEYGHALVAKQFSDDNDSNSSSSVCWKERFAAYLQNVLNDQEALQQVQSDHVQLYATQVLVPYWVGLGRPQRASTLLHQPTFAMKAWMLLNKLARANPLQITLQHLHTIELYLSKLQPSTKKWQEALSLYQGWHTLLQQEVECANKEETLTDDEGDACSHSSSRRSRGSTNNTNITNTTNKRRTSWRSADSNGSGTAALGGVGGAGKSRKREKQPITKSPMQLLVLGRALFALSASLDTVLTELPGHPAMNVLWRRQAEYLKESLMVLAEVTQRKPCVGFVSRKMHALSYLLSASTWLALAQCCATLEESGMASVVALGDLAGLYGLERISSSYDAMSFFPDHDMATFPEPIAVEQGSDEIRCLKVAKELLGEVMLKKRSPTVQLVHSTLQADTFDAVGRWLYDQGLYGPSRLPLEEATKEKREVIALLRESESPENAEEASFWWTWSFGSNSDATKKERTKASGNKEANTSEGYLYYYVGWKPTDSSEKADDMEELCGILRLQPLRVEQQIQEKELSLSQSLEYAALALHACNVSIASLSWMQEGLILKTTHLGKLSLEVARVNSAMAVIHEDLLQWEAALSRYRECLRIRMHSLSQHPPRDWFSIQNEELFRGILQTLRSMGNAYRMVGDHDNAIGCFWKIATLSRREWEIQRDKSQTTFWGFNGHRRMGDELRQTPLPTLVLEEERYSTMQRRKVAAQRNLRDTNVSSPYEARREAVDAAGRENAILFEAAQSYQTILSLFKDKASSTKKEINKYGNSNNLANMIAFEDVPLLLAASYQLSLIHIHVHDYRSAISSLEHCLHCLWILDPSSSSGSDTSDGASSDEEGHRRLLAIKTKRKRTLRGVFGKELAPVEDEAVYHALGMCRAACSEHDQAIRFHLTALRSARRLYGVDSIRACEILYDAAVSYWYMQEYDKACDFFTTCKQIRSTSRSEDDESDGFGCSDYSGIIAADLEYARALYNTGASLCAMGRFSDESVLLSLEESKDIFSEHFGDRPHVEVANCLFYMALAYYRLTLAKPETPQIRSATVCLNKAAVVYRSLGLLATHRVDEKDNHDSGGSLALQAHIRYLEGMIAEAQGKNHLAIDTYDVALRLYRLLGNLWNVYTASVLHVIGRLQIRLLQDEQALSSLTDSWSLRRDCLGRDHESTGESLFYMADIHARSENHTTAMEMFTEALRIQINAEGSDSPAVANTLLKMASIYFRRGEYVKSKEKLKGSLVIRRERVDRVGRASRVVSFWSGDLADDYLSLLTTTREDAVDGNHVRKVLYDDMAKEEVALAVVLHCLGNVYVRLGENQKAKDCYEQSLQVRRRHPVSAVMSPDGDMKLQVCDTLHNLGCLYEVGGDYENALKYFATALKLKHRLYSGSDEEKEPPNTNELVLYTGKVVVDSRYLCDIGTLSYAQTLHRIGTVHHRLGNSDIAVSCLQSALKIQKDAFGTHHSNVAYTYADLATVYRTMENRKEDALKCYREACSIRQQRQGRSADVGHILYRMAVLYDTGKDYSRAVACYRQAIHVFGRRYVDKIGRRFCHSLYIRTMSKKAPEERATSTDMLGMDGLQSVKSIEENDRTQEIDFTTIAAALSKASRKTNGSSDESIMIDMDVYAPDCWISLELYLLSLFDLINVVTREWQLHATISLQEALRQLENCSTEGSTLQDVTTFRMLYLIQD